MISQRLKYLTIALLFSVMIVVFNANLAFSAEGIFKRTLKMGMFGEDVRDLQKVLNKDADTRISATGPGAPGQETAYFGALTRAAVIRFQEKHAAEVLFPAGLISGSGVVGPFTIGALATLQGNIVNMVGTIPSMVPIPVTIASSTNMNPNYVNLDKFMGAIDGLVKKNKISASEVSMIKAQVLKDVATTTDLRATFIKIVEEKDAEQRAAIEKSPTKMALVHVIDTVRKFFWSKEATAQSTVAFGGQLYYAYYCTCSFNWILTLSPLPPSYAALLSYTPFSQAYLTYNIPETEEWLLGNYSSGGQCLWYVGITCAGFPGEGIITPTVGSSAI